MMGSRGMRYLMAMSTGPKGATPVRSTLADIYRYERSGQTVLRDQAMRTLDDLVYQRDVEGKSMYEPADVLAAAAKVNYHAQRDRARRDSDLVDTAVAKSAALQLRHREVLVYDELSSTNLRLIKVDVIDRQITGRYVLTWDELRAAAAQPDTETAAIYREVLRRAEHHRTARPCDLMLGGVPL